MDFEAFNNLPIQTQRLIFRYLNKVGDTKILGFVSGSQKLIKSPIELTFITAYFYAEHNGIPLPSEIQPQYKIEIGDKLYVADFYITNTNVLIECDGYGYHHSSPSKVNYDTNRENELKAEGYDIIHFTGSQINNDPIKCIKQLFDYIESLRERGIIDGNI